MAEALSQSQIDELLNKMRTGGMEELEQEEAENAARAKEKEYDFSFRLVIYGIGSVTTPFNLTSKCT